MADKGNPILKENLCCMLFFLLMPLYALTQSFTPVGIGILIAAAALLILRFAVFDKPDAVLAVGHFGWYLTVSMIASMGISIAAMAPLSTFLSDGMSFTWENLTGGLTVMLTGAALFLAGGIFLSHTPGKTGLTLIRTVTDHAALACIFGGGILLFLREDVRSLSALMLFFALFFILCDCYEQLRRMGFKRHTGVMLAAAVLYFAMLAATLVSSELDAVMLLSGLFGQLKVQLVDSAVLWLLPVLYGLTAFFVCFGGGYAAKEVRYFAAYLVFAAPLYREICRGTEYGWILLLILTCVLLFCLFYPKNPSGALEQKLSAHTEYRIAYAGIFLWLCMAALKGQAYLTVFVLAAFGILLFVLLQTKKLPKGSMLWQVICGGAAVAVWSMLYAAGKPVPLQLACVMTALLSEAALWLYARGGQKGTDGWITAGIGVSAVILQLAFII